MVLALITLARCLRPYFQSHQVVVKANFLAEFIRNGQTTSDWWSLYIDGASNVKGSRARIILEGLENVTLEKALKLNFKASKN